MSVPPIVMQSIGKVKAFPGQVMDLYAAHKLKQNIFSTLETKQRSSKYTSQPLLRPTGFTRYETTHIRQTNVDLMTAVPTSLLCNIPLIGYGFLVIAFAAPRYALSRQFHSEEDKWEYAKSDVGEMRECYARVLDTVSKNSDVDKVNEALGMYRNDASGSDESKFIEETLKPFALGGALDFSADAGLNKSQLVTLASARNITRFHPLLNAVPVKYLRKSLDANARDVKLDDYLINVEKQGLELMLTDDEVRDANVFRGLVIDESEGGREMMRTKLGQHVDVVGKEIGLISGNGGVISPSLVLHLPALIDGAK